MSNPCVKQRTLCKIVRQDGRTYTATNTCEIEGDECPRVAAGCKTGTGYELCGSQHAEANAAKLAEESKHIPGEAFLWGHHYVCEACKTLLRAVGVDKWHIVKS